MEGLEKIPTPRETISLCHDRLRIFTNDSDYRNELLADGAVDLLPELLRYTPPEPEDESEEMPDTVDLLAETLVVLQEYCKKIRDSEMGRDTTLLREAGTLLQQQFKALDKHSEYLENPEDLATLHSLIQTDYLDDINGAVDRIDGEPELPGLEQD